MRTAWISVVVCVAIAASSITTLFLSRLGGAAAVAPSSPGSDSASPQGSGPDLEVAPRTSDVAKLLERLERIERRLGQLEVAARREPAGARSEDGSEDARARPVTEERLRAIVGELMAEDRALRDRAAQQRSAAERVARQEFEARFQAHVFALEHGLEPWQQDEFAALFLEMRRRSDAIEDSIDPERDDPAEVEERWLEFDRWVEEREREVTARVDPELYEAIYGEGG